VSLVAETARLSGVVPSPQSTVKLVTVELLDTLKFTVTVDPVSAGLGETLLTATVGAVGACTETEPDLEPVDPLLSVAVTVTVNAPVVVYA